MHFRGSFINTFSPVVSPDSFRVILSLSATFNLKLRQVDISTAFLNSKLDLPVFLIPPEGTETTSKHVWKLKGAMYGLKQSPYLFNTLLSKIFIKMGFVQSKVDPCIMFKEKERIFLAIYVDGVVTDVLL